MHPVLIDLGFWQIPSYGLLLALGVVVALWTAGRRARTRGLEADRVIDLGLWIVIWALLGSKLTLVVIELPRYLSNPHELLALVRAGGVFLGGFVTGVVAAAVLLRRYELPALLTLDTLAPSVALGQAIGRLGCLAAGCCWGSHCDAPWAITYSNPIAAEKLGTPLGIPASPISGLLVLRQPVIFAGLSWFYRQRPEPGRVFATYLLLYGPARFVLEWTRGDAARGFVFGGALSTSQFISVVMIVAGFGLHLWISRRQKR